VTVRDEKNVIRNSIVGESISIGVVRVDRVHTDEILADPLTKGLAREKVHNTSMKMGLVPMLSGVPSYRSTLDRLNFVNVEVGAASYGIL